MITYYDDGTVRVTSEMVRVGGRSYPLAGLTEVWHRRGRRSWTALAGRGGLIAALLGPLVAAVAGIVIAVRWHSSIIMTVAIVGVSCLVGLAAGPIADLLLDRVDRSYDRGAHGLEIWVRCRDVPVRLLQTRDARRFGQIYRALQRALEQVDAPAGCSAMPPHQQHLERRR